MFKDRSWNFVNSGLMLGIHLAALSALFMPIQKFYFILFFVHYVWFGYSSSLYYHRCLTHRSFEISTPLHIFFLLGGLIGLGGDPISWVAIHRYHHAHADQDDDAHSPQKGFWYAYLLWQMKMDMKQIQLWQKACDDLRKFWFIRLAQGNLPTLIVHSIYALMIYHLFGGAALLFGFYLPLVLSYQFFWMLIASLCHHSKFGVRAANTKDQSRNIWWLGPFSFGESFHNNHHEMPKKLRVGKRWFEWDLTARTVELLESIGLAKSIVR